MLTPSRFLLRARALVLFSACLLVVSALPVSTTMAAFKQNTIDNSVADFGRGQFQRAALGNLLNTAASPKLVDLPGAVRLGPIGILKSWTNSPFNLKKALLRMGATAISNRVYVIGGTTPVGSAQQSVAEVWSAAVNQSTGAFIEDWQTEPALPAVVGSNQTQYGLAVPVAEINSPAVVSVSTGGSAGYIYVIGGNTSPSTSSIVDFSSYAVRIGVVGANGRISSWKSGPTIPSPDGDTDTFGQLGLQSPMATARQINGSTYIYLVGGLRRFRTGNGASLKTVSEGQKTVFYAKVSGDQLVKPSTGAQGWDRLDDVPLSDPTNGIWDGTVMADNFVVSTGATHNALYVVGGQLTPNDPTAFPPVLPTFSSVAYRAFINDNGTLTWDGWTGTLQQTRNGLSGVTFRGTLYAVGGIPDGAGNNEPDLGVLTTYVDDDLKLHQFDTLPPGTVGSGTNFLKSDALPVPRTFQSSALVVADASSPNSAFIYVLGGRGKTNDADTGDDNGSNSVIYGKIGGSEDVSTTGYASTGWYYSQPFDINISGAQLQEISWATVIDRTIADPDIQVDFRVTSANSCSSADWTENSWTPLNGSTTDPHRSVNGQNATPVTNLAARCFQYRAQLTTNNYLVTPSLLNLSIKVFIPGGPDLSVQPITARTTGKLFTGLNVVIQNVNQLSPPTLAADVDGGGSFYVDMCIFASGTTVTPPTLPLTLQNKQCSKAYSQVDKSAMGPNATYSVTRWFDTATDQPVDLISYFKPGSYTVIVAVDSYVDDAATSPKGYVDEGDLDKGESNNVSAAFTFQVQEVGHAIYIAQMRR